MTRKVKINANSRAAYESLDPDRVKTLHEKIVDALGVIGEGNFEKIALQAGEEEKRIWKRINEVVKKGLIHDTGKTIKTKDHCDSTVYALGKSPESVKKKERVMKGKTVAQFSKDILSIHGQERLF